MIIGYLVHDLNDPSVERRCQMFERGGGKVILVGFFRGEKLKPNIAKRSPLVLGTTKDGAMLNRVMGTLHYVVSNRELVNFCQDCDVIVARNLEQLAIANQITKSRPLIYECLDLHRLLITQSLPAKIVQGVEAKLLPNVDALLTSSPAFLRKHFDSTNLVSPKHLIENKLLVDVRPDVLPDPTVFDGMIRIGWFGMLRCKKTFEVLREIAAQSDGRIEIMISGKPSTAELPNLPEEAEVAKGVTFTGAYTYADLPELYGKCHFAWAIDWFEEGLNSEWLLPNRLYESIAYGTVPIVKKNTEMGRWLEQRKVGLRVPSTISPNSAILNLTSSDVETLQSELNSVLVGDVIADNSDCFQLVELLNRVVREK